VEGLGNQLLAGSLLADDQHREVCDPAAARSSDPLWKKRESLTSPPTCGRMVSDSRTKETRMFLPLVALLAPFPLLSPPEGIFSGPQKGEKTPPFKVLDLNGPNQGKEIDYITSRKDAPTVLCFLHELTRPPA